jgi:hypothetical protein
MASCEFVKIDGFAKSSSSRCLFTPMIFLKIVPIKSSPKSGAIPVKLIY